MVPLGVSGNDEKKSSLVASSKFSFLPSTKIGYECTCWVLKTKKLNIDWQVIKIIIKSNCIIIYMFT
jgi:hypothetical protein